MITAYTIKNAPIPEPENGLCRYIARHIVNNYWSYFEMAKSSDIEHKPILVEIHRDNFANYFFGFQQESYYVVINIWGKNDFKDSIRSNIYASIYKFDPSTNTLASEEPWFDIAVAIDIDRPIINKYDRYHDLVLHYILRNYESQLKEQIELCKMNSGMTPKQFCLYVKIPLLSGYSTATDCDDVYITRTIDLIVMIDDVFFNDCAPAVILRSDNTAILYVDSDTYDDDIDEFNSER